MLSDQRVHTPLRLDHPANQVVDGSVAERVDGRVEVLAVDVDDVALHRTPAPEHHQSVLFYSLSESHAPFF